MLPRVIRRVVPLLLASVLTLAACRGVSPAQMASMPPENYRVEYYMISER